MKVVVVGGGGGETRAPPIYIGGPGFAYIEREKKKQITREKV